MAAMAEAWENLPHINPEGYARRRKLKNEAVRDYIIWGKEKLAMTIEQQAKINRFLEKEVVDLTLRVALADRLAQLSRDGEAADDPPLEGERQSPTACVCITDVFSVVEVPEPDDDGEWLQKGMSALCAPLTFALLTLHP